MKKENVLENTAADKANIFSGEKYRISFITERLVRFEYSETGNFIDRATQRVQFRNLGKVEITKSEKKDGIELETEYLKIFYDEKNFSKHGLRVSFKRPAAGCDLSWFYGKEDKLNLGGTARTLDNADGEVELEKGILSLSGFTVLEDESLLLSEEGYIEERKEAGIDFYLFAYARDYKSAIKDFCRISGRIPLLPRYALGNWWSRYYAYTQEEYLELMQRFCREEIPFSVAVIDMDWHLTDIDKKYGDAWTGYTWNRELFPNPKEFLEKLHNMGLHTSLNVHPALGVRAYEEQYKNMAEALNKDPESEKTIEFDPASTDFMKAYFEVLHHPKERDGVDFWWIDWQQGENSGLKGLDPLWALNHYHYLDSGREGKRRMTFSRYAGIGSHRYPVGFSGDSVISWKSLSFQPYFTYTASNIAYSWWSHDIGGHMLGSQSDNLMVRWCQFGIFSPINRLHSTKSVFGGKEPWNFGMEARHIICKNLQFRHRLIPYLYTMNYLSYKEYRPLIVPMYYEYPNEENAYPGEMFLGGGFKNQYIFGNDFIVAPITSENISYLGMGKVKVWLPKGIYHDIFTGIVYKGEKIIWMYRKLESIPVLAKAGAIIPLQNKISKEALENPDELTVCIYAGANGKFTLYEDDNISEYEEERTCFTDMELCWDKGKFIISHAKGDTSLIKPQRKYYLEIYGINDNIPKVTCAGKELDITWEYIKEKHCMKIELETVPVYEDIELKYEEQVYIVYHDIVKKAYEILNSANEENKAKENAYKLIKDEDNKALILAGLHTCGLKEDTILALTEVLTASL